MERTRICLETSIVNGYLRNEFECKAIDGLFAMVENGALEIYISDLAWNEIFRPLTNEHEKGKKEKLLQLARHLPKMEQLELWLPEIDIPGLDDSGEINGELASTIREDVEQFLSYATLGVSYLVTREKEYYLNESICRHLSDKYGFRICTPQECLDYLTAGQ